MGPKTHHDEKPKVIIVGAGIVGICCAYEAAVRGFDVTVLEKNKNVAGESSYMNGSLICPGLVRPWTGLGIVPKVLNGFLDSTSIIRLHPGQLLDIDTLRWSYYWLKGCHPSKYAENTGKLARLSRMSAMYLKRTAIQHNLESSCDFSYGGSLQVFDNIATAQHILDESAEIIKAGTPLELIPHAEMLSRYPQLFAKDESNGNVKNEIVGIMSPSDVSGDCYKFACELQHVSVSLGVKYVLGTSVKSIQCTDTGDGIATTGIELENGNVLKSDFVIVCGGITTNVLLRPLGIYCPILPVKGYVISMNRMGSWTATEKPMQCDPCLVQDHNKLYLAPLGNECRVSGLAEVAGTDTSVSPFRAGILTRAAERMFPEKQLLSEATKVRCCLRPVTPDDVPIIGKTKVQNLLVNCGHGSKGWTGSMGSARLLLDIMTK